MMYKTARFGDLEVDQDQILVFSQGLPGFPDLTKFFIVPVPERECFCWLQSAERAEVGFLLANPFAFYKDYEFNLSETELELLEIEELKDVVVYVIVRIPADGAAKDITVNLLAPVVINGRQSLGCQPILEGTTYSIREPLFADMRRNRRKGAAQC